MFHFIFYNFNNFQNHLVYSTNTRLWYCNTCFHNTIHVSARYKPTTFLLGCSMAHTNNTMYHYLTWTYIFTTISVVHYFRNHARLECHEKLSWRTSTAHSLTLLTGRIHTRTSLPRHYAGFLSLPRRLQTTLGNKKPNPVWLFCSAALGRYSDLTGKLSQVCPDEYREGPGAGRSHHCLLGLGLGIFEQAPP